jgi:hypothetical protein
MFIFRWPLERKFPGPDFSMKTLRNRELRILVGPYLKRKLGTMYDDERPEGQDEKDEFEILPWQKGALFNFFLLFSANFNFSQSGSSGVILTSESKKYCWLRRMMDIHLGSLVTVMSGRRFISLQSKRRMCWMPHD